jgi:hypothetical protein
VKSYNACKNGWNCHNNPRAWKRLRSGRHFIKTAALVRMHDGTGAMFMVAAGYFFIGS